MEDALIVFTFFAFLFGAPGVVALVRMVLAHRLEVARLQAGGGGREEGEIEALREEARQLTERIETLETIVTSVDMELNQRLNRLLSEVSQAQLLPDREGPTQVLAPGRTLRGRYEIEEEIGRGGMGAVFRAWDPHLEEHVAIKVILPLYWGNDELRQRFLREASAARRIAHPNVVRVYDIDMEGDLLYICMEYFEGRPLKEMLSAEGMSVQQALTIIVHVLDGLGAAHDAGVIHRDLKPHNILVSATGAVKVIDFGLALPATTASVTLTGVVVGTPAYMAPELLRGAPASPASDLYSIGVLLYEMLAGRRPFERKGPLSAAAVQRTDPIPALAERRPDLPPELTAALRRVLAPEPADRFGSARELATALRGIHLASSPSPRVSPSASTGESP